MELPSHRNKRITEPASLKDAELAFLALLLRGTGKDVVEDIEVTKEECGSFYRAARNYYKVTRREVETLHMQGLPLEDCAVALHMAQCASVESSEVLRFRLEGISWPDILEYLNLSPEIFYVPVTGPLEPVPRKTHNYYRGKARQAWNILALSDADIVNLVNLKFVSEYYGYRPERVIALCSNGWSFTAIHAEANQPKPVQKATTRASNPKKIRK